MNVTYACPQCGQPARKQVDESTEALVCPHCRQELRIPEGAYHDGRLTRCIVCPSVDLFVRKDFPQRVGVGLVAIGIVGSSAAWYYGNVIATFAILFGTALADFVLYLVVGDALMCYRCHAEYRQLRGLDTHGAFDLETHERHRQLAARLKESERGQVVHGPRT
jgi:hypothetical protein